MFRWGRFIGWMTGLVNRIIGLALSVFLLLLAAKPALFIDSDGGRGGLFGLEDIESWRTLLACIGALILVLNLNVIQFIIYNLWNNDLRRFIYSKTTSGTARVSLDAIEGALRDASKAVPEIERSKIRVYRIGGKRYKVEVRYWIPRGCNVLNINEKLRLILKKRFSELVSIQPDDRVFFDISLAGFKGKKKKSYPSSPGPSGSGVDASGRPFQGPIYPVDG